MLRLTDILLTGLHLAIIGFNLFGWIWPLMRRAHLFLVVATAFCWLVLGLWFGIGYCPITDWQWQVKAQLGVRNLPPSFITWGLLKLTGHRFPDGLVNAVTATAFAAAAILAVYFNFFQKRHKAERP